MNHGLLRRDPMVAQRVDKVNLNFSMSEDRISEISPKDIQALWLLIQSGRSFHENKLNLIAQEVLTHSTAADLKRLLAIGKSIGLFSQCSGLWKLTSQGRDFKKTVHWRLWTPAEQTRAILKEQRILHFFIGTQEYEKSPAIIDLFAGVGGLSLGFAAAGFRTVLAIENDQQAYEAHAANFPQTLVIQDDVNNFAANPNAYLDKIQQLHGVKIAGIIGGPPCQGFSYIGERSNGDPRNLLTFRFIDIVLELKPCFFVMENVPGLLTSGIPPNFGEYIKRLAKSNSEPALSIINRLPTVPKKVAPRDTQFRKRLVNSAIRGLKRKVDEYFSMRRPCSLQDMQQAFDYSYKEFKCLIAEMLCGLYHDEAFAEKVSSEIESEMCVIAVAPVLANLLISKSPLENGKLSRQLRQGSLLPKKLQVAVTKIFEDYDNARPAAEYRGQKVGPLLLQLLERAGTIYDIPPPQILNSASFGTPQNRDRVFIVGFLKELKKSFVYPEPTHSSNGTQAIRHPPTVSEAIGDLPDIDEMFHLIKDETFSAKKLRSTASEFARRMRYDILEDGDLSLPRSRWDPYTVDCSNRTTHKEHVKARIKTLGEGEYDAVSRGTRLHPDCLSATIRAGTKPNKGAHTAVRPFHYKYNRVISVREGARLMGYPDWMTFHKTKWHGFRLLGNGVPFPLSHAIAKQIWKLLYEPLS